MLNKIISLFLFFLININSLRSETIQSLRENQFLQTELSLAKKPKVYCIFNLNEEKIYLKIKGVSLKEWEIKKVRYWGDPLQGGVKTLFKKITLFPPKRANIKPAEKRDVEDFKLEALELSQIPSSYTLLLDDGIRLSVRQKKKGLSSVLLNIELAFKWYIFLPLESVWHTVNKKSFTHLSIMLNSKKEAQALYWALNEGTECIFISP